MQRVEQRDQGQVDIEGIKGTAVPNAAGGEAAGDGASHNRGFAFAKWREQGEQGDNIGARGRSERPLSRRRGASGIIGGLD